LQDQVRDYDDDDQLVVPKN